MSHMIRSMTILAVLVGFLPIADAQQKLPKTGRVTVDAKSNIFWAGQERFAVDGVNPSIITIPKGKDRYIEFTVTGETDCGLGIKAGPDGGTCGQRTNVESSTMTGIGGLIHNSKTMFLVGVFLSDAPPPSFPPPKFDYSSGTRTAVPNHVTFIIGDGLSGTGQGERLRFPVPPNATRIFLGFVDGRAGNTVEGEPGGYANNTGSLDVRYVIGGEAGQAAPEGPDEMGPSAGAGGPPPPALTPVTSSQPPAAPPVAVSTAPRACPANAPVATWSRCSGVFFDAATESIYTGEFLNGQFHGVGVLRGRDGVYSGELIAGRFAGFGVFTMVDGRRYVGQFVAGSMSGLGRLIDAQGGEVFSGQFVDGVPRATLAQRPSVPAPPPAAPVAVTPPMAPPVAPPMAPVGMRSDIPDGVYLRTQMFGSSLVTEVFQVKANRIASGPKKYLKDSEFTADNARKIGTVRTEGDRAIIRWEGDDKDTSNTYAKNSNCPNFSGGIVCRVETFRPGERVSGTFSGTIGSSAVSQSVRLQLNTDGTYSLRRIGIVNAPSAGGVSEGVETGRYTLADSSLRMQRDDGVTQEYLVFPYPADAPKWLWFGDRMLDGAVSRGN